MATPLKTKNKVALAAIVVGNLVLYWAFLKSGELQAGDWFALFQSLPRLAPASFGLILISIINAQLSPEAKARIVFFRWKNPLPGCRAFSELMHGDSRIDVRAIKRIVRTLPTAPIKQNSTWYKLYRTVDKDPAVLEVHQEFLFTRDYATLALFAGIALAITAFFQFSNPTVAWIYAGVLAIQFLLVTRAAQSHGKGLVTTVLALKSAGR